MGTDWRTSAARQALAAIRSGPDWLYRLVPFRAYTALLRLVQEQEDREAAAIYRASCERARMAWLAQREANGPGCPYCPNEELTSFDADGTRYKECPACGGSWSLADSPDADNPYDELRPLAARPDIGRGNAL